MVLSMFKSYGFHINQVPLCGVSGFVKVNKERKHIMNLSKNNLFGIGVLNILTLATFVYFSEPTPHSSISAEQITAINRVIEKAVNQHLNKAVYFDTRYQQSGQEQGGQTDIQASVYPTLQDIRKIVRDEVSGVTMNADNNQVVAIEMNASESMDETSDSYQEALRDSNIMLSKVLSNQPLNPTEKEQWAKDVSKLSVRDKETIVEKIAAALNNQELQPGGPVDLPF